MARASTAPAWSVPAGDLRGFDQSGPEDLTFTSSTGKARTELLLPAIPAKVVHAALLAGGEATVFQTEQGIEITVPAGSRNDTDTIVVLELDQPADRIKSVAPIGN